MKKLLFFIIILSILWASNKSNYLIVLSMDGFRYDYTDKCETPNFDYLYEIGVKSEMIPAFPSKTFPNHYTMATGLYPDNHGLIFNNFYDYEKQEWYKVSDRKSIENGNFYGGEPIWNTAEKQGVTAATLFWVGSEADIENLQPTYWKKYQHNMPFESRIDTVIAWLQKPKPKRPRLIMWYLHEPDGWGHKFGPENEKMVAKIQYLDTFFGQFHNELQKLSIYDSINVILTSDHGMGDIDINRVVYFDDYIKKSWINRENGSNPVWMFEPAKNYEDSILINLQKNNHLQAWKKSEIPEYLHYGKNNNIMPIVVVADSGWTISWKSDIKDQKYLGGTHGYDPKNRDMHAFFYAFGPDFKQNYPHDAFQNIHLYALMAKLLKLNPVNTDGDLNEVKEMLRKNNSGL